MNESFLRPLLKKAKGKNKRILFPEVADDRVARALASIIKTRLCHPVLIGESSAIKKQLGKFGMNAISLAWHKNHFTVISPEDTSLKSQLTKKLYLLRKKKGVTIKSATQLLEDPNYFATACLAAGLADGMVSGAATTTSAVLRPALQIIRTPKNAHASGAFLILPPNHPPLLFADCAVTPDPTAKELAAIARSTAQTAALLGLEAKVALLSFSSHSSAGHLPQTDKIIAARQILKKTAPMMIMDGELQADAALDPEVAQFKTPTSPLRGQANVLIFPTLEAGNIGYKLVERLGGAGAIGTIVQNLRKPVNDLSRGCSSSDIIYLTAITVLQTLS